MFFFIFLPHSHIFFSDQPGRGVCSSNRTSIGFGWLAYCRPDAEWPCRCHGLSVSHPQTTDLKSQASSHQIGTGPRGQMWRVVKWGMMGLRLVRWRNGSLKAKGHFGAMPFSVKGILNLNMYTIVNLNSIVYLNSIINLIVNLNSIVCLNSIINLILNLNSIFNCKFKFNF